MRIQLLAYASLYENKAKFTSHYGNVCSRWWSSWDDLMAVNKAHLISDEQRQSRVRTCSTARDGAGKVSGSCRTMDDFSITKMFYHCAVCCFVVMLFFFVEYIFVFILLAVECWNSGKSSCSEDECKAKVTCRSRRVHRVHNKWFELLERERERLEAWGQSDARIKIFLSFRYAKLQCYETLTS